MRYSEQPTPKAMKKSLADLEFLTCPLTVIREACLLSFYNGLTSL